MNMTTARKRNSKLVIIRPTVKSSIVNTLLEGVSKIDAMKQITNALREVERECYEF